MAIEINRARVQADGRVTCEMVFPNIGSFSRATNEVLRIEAEAFAPREPTAPPLDYRYDDRRAIADRLPRANVPPFVDFADNPCPGVLMADPEEPPLRNGEAYEPHELKAGGTSSDDED